MKCPRCGYSDEQGSPPDWLLTMRYMHKHGGPIFGGLLADDRWTADDQLVMFMEKGWVEIVKEHGFILTKKGRQIAFGGKE